MLLLDQTVLPPAPASPQIAELKQAYDTDSKALAIGMVYMFFIIIIEIENTVIAISQYSATVIFWGSDLFVILYKRGSRNE